MPGVPAHHHHSHSLPWDLHVRHTHMLLQHLILATCTACSSTCPANSYLSSTCSWTTTLDTSACTCNPGYYKSRSTCVACFECPEPLFSSAGTACSWYCTTDTVRCDCRGNSYINGLDFRGLSCAWCTFCNHNADFVNWCDGY